MYLQRRRPKPAAWQLPATYRPAGPRALQMAQLALGPHQPEAKKAFKCQYDGCPCSFVHQSSLLNHEVRKHGRPVKFKRTNQFERLERLTFPSGASSQGVKSPLGPPSNVSLAQPTDHSPPTVQQSLGTCGQESVDPALPLPVESSSSTLNEPFSQSTSQNALLSPTSLMPYPDPPVDTSISSLADDSAESLHDAAA